MLAQHILIIDDDPGICDLLESITESAGFEVRSAANHIEFEHQLSDFQPEMVVMDLTLPDVDGGDPWDRVGEEWRP